MSQYEIAIAALLAAQAATLYLLWEAVKRGGQWQAMWTRDASELLEWKRNGIMRDQLHDMTAYEVYELAQWKRYGVLRDPKTGRYIKKDKR